jgi:hypothetical protein
MKASVALSCAAYEAKTKFDQPPITHKRLKPESTIPNEQYLKSILP